MSTEVTPKCLFTQLDDKVIVTDDICQPPLILRASSRWSWWTRMPEAWPSSLRDTRAMGFRVG